MGFPVSASRRTIRVSRRGRVVAVTHAFVIGWLGLGRLGLNSLIRSGSLTCSLSLSLTLRGARWNVVDVDEGRLLPAWFELHHQIDGRQIVDRNAVDMPGGQSDLLRRLTPISIAPEPQVD